MGHSRECAAVSRAIIPPDRDWARGDMMHPEAAPVDAATQRRRWGSALRGKIDAASVAELRNQLLTLPGTELPRDSDS